MRILALALALFLAACAGPRLVKPSVSLAGLDIDSVGLFEQRYVLKLRVKNPNDIDIPVEGLNFDLEIAGQHFANGVSDRAVTIPRLGEAVLEVKATSNLASFLRQLGEAGLGSSSSLDYRVKGDLRVSGYGSLPFDHRGETSLPKWPFGEPKPKTKPVPGAV